MAVALVGLTKSVTLHGMSLKIVNFKVMIYDLVFVI